MPPVRRPETGTAEQVLDVAERLIQTRGFNGFSYADISVALGITKASLHYHFRTKADLGRAIMDRYSARFGEALAVIGGSADAAPAKLDAYALLYLEVLRDERMCLCGMLAAEQSTLPPAMQEGLRAFFDMNEAWLARVFADGAAEGSFRLVGSPGDTARMVLGALEGSMLVARSYSEPERFEAAVNGLLGGLRS